MIQTKNKNKVDMLLRISLDQNMARLILRFMN